jgi:hypothetical protein
MVLEASLSENSHVSAEWMIIIPLSFWLYSWSNENNLDLQSVVKWTPLLEQMFALKRLVQ